MYNIKYTNVVWLLIMYFVLSMVQDSWPYSYKPDKRFGNEVAPGPNICHTIPLSKGHLLSIQGPYIECGVVPRDIEVPHKAIHIPARGILAVIVPVPHIVTGTPTLHTTQWSNG